MKKQTFRTKPLHIILVNYCNWDCCKMLQNEHTLFMESCLQMQPLYTWSPVVCWHVYHSDTIWCPRSLVTYLAPYRRRNIIGTLINMTKNNYIPYMNTVGYRNNIRFDISYRMGRLLRRGDMVQQCAKPVLRKCWCWLPSSGGYQSMK